MDLLVPRLPWSADPSLTRLAAYLETYPAASHAARIQELVDDENARIVAYYSKCFDLSFQASGFMLGILSIDSEPKDDRSLLADIAQRFLASVIISALFGIELAKRRPWWRHRFLINLAAWYNILLTLSGFWQLAQAYERRFLADDRRSESDTPIQAVVSCTICLVLGYHFLMQRMQDFHGDRGYDICKIARKALIAQQGWKRENEQQLIREIVTLSAHNAAVP